MDSQDRDVLGALRRWHAEGHRAALVTLARTWGSAPRPAGSWLALRDDGLLRGSVSGGCIEDDLVARQRAGEFADGAMRVLRYGATADEARRFGLPCGGALELVLEPLPDMVLLAELAQRTAAGEVLGRCVDTENGEVSLQPVERLARTQWDGRVLLSVHGPRRRLLLIGAGPISRVLAQMAPALDFAVSVCDPREEYAREWDIPECPLLPGMPDDVVLALRPDAATAIVALTHDPKLDDMALLEALKSEAFYVGALGSQRSNGRRRQRLAEHFDLTPAQLARLHGPVGLAIGSRTPPEIAVAVLAELVAVMRGAAAGARSAGVVADASDGASATCR